MNDLTFRTGQKDRPWRSQREFQVSEDLSTADARKLTDRIKERLTGDIFPMVKIAWQRRADRALGYDSWEDYCGHEFGVLFQTGDESERRERALSLYQDESMPVRAIAPVLGIKKSTVHNDIVAERERLTTLGSGAVRSPDTSSTGGSAPSRNVIGLDGKVYPQPRPKLTPLPVPITMRPDAGEVCLPVVIDVKKTPSPLGFARAIEKTLAYERTKIVTGDYGSPDVFTPEHRQAIAHVEQAVENLVRVFLDEEEKWANKINAAHATQEASGS